MQAERIRSELTKARRRLEGLNEQIERPVDRRKRLQLRLSRDRVAFLIADLEYQLTLAQTAEERRD
jgi:hypothetical protein